ncbi:MAG TPA: CoB--CoM heterodisulfide reductase subunit B [candidate division WOR-3 bacterium]|uniref:CoB--CoM heterodisulfide reductase subunit B n=1 Tax=candidate division WOR-3 bacterium TaxID=2052148 RepID=A0A9C9JZW6_UNCW3|nr:CoB--CoM heterodisulfide reductase subunit B [candidate division WOR-3 bacterium]
MKKYALFLGCTVPVRAQHYELSARNTAKQLDIEFVDMNGASCCGFPIKAVDAETALLIAARNISIASKMGLNIVTLCNSCTAMLSDAQLELKNNRFYKKFKELGFTYPQEITVKHFVRMLYEDIGVEKLKKSVKVPLNNLKVISHYGCHYMRPSYLYGFDNPEVPHTFDELVNLTGAKSLQYTDKKMCCGGSVLGIDEGLAVTMANHKLNIAESNEADALISICPFCTVMYEDNQRKAEEKFNKQYNLPVLYYPQLLGLSFGLDKNAVGIRFNRVRPNLLLEKIGGQ